MCMCVTRRRNLWTGRPIYKRVFNFMCYKHHVSLTTFFNWVNNPFFVCLNNSIPAGKGWVTFRYRASSQRAHPQPQSLPPATKLSWDSLVQTPTNTIEERISAKRACLFRELKESAKIKIGGKDVSIWKKIKCNFLNKFI